MRPARSANGTTARSIPITRTPAASTSSTASCSGHWGTYFDPPLEHNGQPVRGQGYIADDLTDHALAFIEQTQGPAVLLLRAVQHAAFADAGARPVLRQVRRARTEAARPRSGRRGRRLHPRRAGDVREHRLERRPRAAAARRAEAGRQHDRDLLQRQRPEQPALERRHERHQGLDRRRRRAGAVSDPLARPHPGRHARFRRSPAPSTCCPRWPTWPASRVVSRKPLDGVSLKPLLLGTASRLARPA